MIMKRSFRIDAGNRSKADVEREIALHLELRAKEFEAAGMSPEAAREAALAAFGDRGEIESEVQGIHARTVDRRRSREWMQEFRQDLRVGFRMLLRAPAFTIIAVLTLAVGIGANTAIFSVLRSVLLRPLPYAQPEQVAMVWNSWTGWEETWLSEPEVLEYRAGAPSIEHLAAYSTGTANITGEGEPERVASANLTANIFAALGVRTVVGRGFVEEEDRPGADPVAVLSYDLWQRRFGGT